ncbi:transmembrane protein 125 [Erpetoichthys calabaricus]|uniref:transmembrane protein 125 n=1 Tax=Erpetoichthys calabaricus TaxID=27687 RepID=UPI0010A072D7|nr:transmembrane protein 125 [Erpetoichthys calabaricus]
MSELEDLSPPRTPADPVQIQRNVLEEQVELWWFRDPKKSILCYCASLILILGCGLGGVGLLSTTSSISSEWRLGVGMMLCLLALIVLLKQLLSSAIQDMNCIRSRAHIEMLKSGGLSDHLVILLTGLILVICGTVLLIISDSLSAERPKASPHNDMFITGVVLATAGATTMISLAAYVVCFKHCQQTSGSPRQWQDRFHIYTISGQIAGNTRETTASTTNLI